MKSKESNKADENSFSIETSSLGDVPEEDDQSAAKKKEHKKEVKKEEPKKEAEKVTDKKPVIQPNPEALAAKKDKENTSSFEIETSSLAEPETDVKEVEKKEKKEKKEEKKEAKKSLSQKHKR